MKKHLIYLIALPLLAAVIHGLVSRANPAPPNIGTSVQVKATSLPAHTLMQEAATQSPVHDNSIELQAALEKTSLAGTQPPPLPAVDADGNVAPQRALREVFDYFLSLSGESDPADIHALIKAYVALHLPAHAATQVMQILAQYQTLNESLTKLANSLEGDSLQEKLQKITALRREILGEEFANAFFDDEEAYDRYSLAMLERHQGDDKNADPLDTQSDLLASLPAELQERQRERLRQQYLVEGTERLEKQGATAAELYQFHVLHGDAAIAERYQTLAAQRDAWQQRLSNYRNQRESITRLLLSDSEKTARIQELQSASFSKTEILRVNALENMETR